MAGKQSGKTPFNSKVEKPNPPPAPPKKYPPKNTNELIRAAIDAQKPKNEAKYYVAFFNGWDWILQVTEFSTVKDAEEYVNTEFGRSGFKILKEILPKYEDE